jgi:hypothetical protein
MILIYIIYSTMCIYSPYIYLSPWKTNSARTGKIRQILSAWKKRDPHDLGRWERPGSLEAWKRCHSEAILHRYHGEYYGGTMEMEILISDKSDHFCWWYYGDTMDILQQKCWYGKIMLIFSIQFSQGNSYNPSIASTRCHHFWWSNPQCDFFRTAGPDARNLILRP